MRKVKKDLMRIFLASPADYRAVLLTDHAVGILDDIKNHDYPTISSSELAEKLYISIQSASGQLTRLWAKGYLEREERTDPTGGIFYRYKLSEDIY